MKYQQALKQFVLEELERLGVTTTQSGANIYECDFDELKYELTLASFREIDAEIDANRWF